jgi:hypothetical protein
LDRDSVNETLYVIGVQLLRDTGRVRESVELGRTGLIRLSQVAPALRLRMELARSLLLMGEASQALVEVDVVLGFRPEDPEATRLRADIVSALR